jgi:hypothetical protein
MSDSPLFVVVSAIAWPTATLILAFAFRQPLSKLLARIRSLRYGKFSASLDHALELSSLLVGTSYESRARSVEMQRPLIELVDRICSKADPAKLNEQLDDLAREYENTRGDMRSSDDRTRHLDLIAARMRVLSPAARERLAELADSKSSGRRLVAITALQVKPDAKFLGWLFQCAHDPSAFIQFHALLALRPALRVLTRDQSTMDQFKGLATKMQSLPRRTERRKLYEEMRVEFGLGKLRKRRRSRRRRSSRGLASTHEPAVQQQDHESSNWAA